MNPLHRVLCIDDVESNIHLMERILARRGGFDVHAALRGREGIDKTRELHPDLVLLDLRLPDMSGLDVLRELRADAATADVPVVVVSADPGPEQERDLIAAGAFAYVVKPFAIQEFLEVVDRAIAGAG